VEGLKRAKVKSLNYSQVTVVQKGPEENPPTFLQCLKDAIRKHTIVDPESQVGEVLLKDKFLTPSAPDICRKLQSLQLKGKKNHWTN
jgi:alkyl hydroperoxide reductase subunit AhpC